MQILQLLILFIGVSWIVFHKWFEKFFPSIKTDLSSKRKKALNENLDLAIGLGSCIVFTLTAGHSVVIAGNNSTVSYLSVVFLSIIALTFGIVVTYAWKRNRMERSLWSLSLVSIAILLIGNGGPLSPISGEEGKLLEPALPYWIAMSALIIIFVSFFLAEFPHRVDIRSGKHTVFYGLMIFCIILLCFGSGKSWVQETKLDPRTPVALGTEASSILKRIDEDLTPEYVHKFYRIASEIELEDFYRINFFSTLKETKKLKDQLNQGISPLNDSSWDTYYVQQRKASSGYADFDYFIETNNLLKESYFLSENDRTQYLLKRLEWRHPISNDYSRSRLGVPGIDAETRHRGLFIPTNRYALIDLRKTYGTRPFESTSQRTPDELEQAEQDFSYRVSGVFPNIVNLPYRNRLIKHLSLPLIYESGITFLLYQQAALNNSEEPSLANQQYSSLNAESLPILINETNNRQRIEALFKFINCNSLKEIRTDLKHISTTSRQYLVYQSLSEIDNQESSQPNEKLIELFTIIGNLYEQETVSTPAPDGTTKESTKTFDAKEEAERFLNEFRQCEISDDHLKNLLNTNQSGFSTLLLSPEVLDFVKSLGEENSNDSNQDNAVNDNQIDIAVSNIQKLYSPISTVWVDKLSSMNISHTNSSASNSYENLLGIIKDYNKIDKTSNERHNLLHHLSVKLYGSGPSYGSSTKYSPTLIGYVISQTHNDKTWTSSISIILASVLVFPFFALAIVLGFMGGRSLVSRSAILIQADGVAIQSNNISISPPDSPTLFQGRKKLLKSLKAYAKRGWNTIALVGPRGVGKSEILKELVRSNTDTPSDRSIGVWLQAPTNFEEIAIVQGVQRRIAEVLESKVSHYLGAASLAERELREDAHNKAMRILIAVLILAYVLVNSASNNITRLDSSAIWIPVGILAIASICCWVSASLSLQGKDLGMWMRRSSKTNPHLELLYERCMREIFGFDTSTYRVMNLLRVVQVIAIALVTIALIGVVKELTNFQSALPFSDFLLPFRSIYFPLDSQIDPKLKIFLGAAILFFAAYILRREFSHKKQTELSWASAVENYRDFLRFCIKRLNSGAFHSSIEKDHSDSNSTNADWSLIIAIDELDRITEARDLRKAIIRMRSLFEIRGAYYYLSLASDSYDAFFNGDSRTKTEMDSAFDHTVSIKALSYENTKEVIVNYLVDRKTEEDSTSKTKHLELKPEILNALVLLSYGIPRDTIRKSDRVLAIKGSKKFDEITIEMLMDTLEIKPIDEFFDLNGEISPKNVLHSTVVDILNSVIVFAASNFDQISDKDKLISKIMSTGFDYYNNLLSEERMTRTVREIYAEIQYNSSSKS